MVFSRKKSNSIARNLRLMSLNFRFRSNILFETFPDLINDQNKCGAYWKHAEFMIFFLSVLGQLQKFFTSKQVVFGGCC